MLSAFCTATAVPVADRVDVDPDRTVTDTAPFTFVHDITDGLGAYVAGIDTITSALLSIHLVDFVDKDRETFSFVIGSGSGFQILEGANLNNGSRGAVYEISLGSALADLMTDGKLEVTLRAATGSYEFVDSTLVAQILRGDHASRPPQDVIPTAIPLAVPEPSVFVLGGISLLGFAAVRRRNR